MKKLILSTALFFGTLVTVSAQKNTLLVAGNISYEKDDQNDTRTYDFSPKIGYQFSDHWTIGVESAMGRSENKSTSDAINNYSLGGFVRYTLPINKTFAFFTDFSGGYKRLEDKTSLSYVVYDGFYASATPSLFINMKNGFGLNFNIGSIGYSKLDGKDFNYERSDFNANFGRSVGFGISKNFGLN
ncbi:MAG: porin family protein [Flavobacteriales bacterium]